MLDKLYSLHENLKAKNNLPFATSKYLKLKDGKQKDHFERVIEAVEGMLLNYQLNTVEFKRNFNALKTESYFAWSNKKNIIGLESYCVEMSKWWEGINHSALEKVYATKGLINITAYTDDDYSFLVDELKKEYEAYTRKNQFLQLAKKSKQHEFEKARNTKIANPQPHDPNIPSVLNFPRPILMLILSFITEAKDLLNLELVNVLFRSIASNSDSWTIALEKRLAEPDRMKQELKALQELRPTANKRYDFEQIHSQQIKLSQALSNANWFSEAFHYLAIGGGSENKGAAFLAEKPKNKYKQTFIHAKNRKKSDDEERAYEANQSYRSGFSLFPKS